MSRLLGVRASLSTARPAQLNLCQILMDKLNRAHGKYSRDICLQQTRFAVGGPALRPFSIPHQIPTR